MLLLVFFIGLLFVIMLISSCLFDSWFSVVVMCVVSVGDCSFGCMVIRKCSFCVCEVRVVVMI